MTGVEEGCKPCRESQISVACAELDSQLERLEHSLKFQDARLSPILRPEAETTAGGQLGNEPKERMAPLAAFIDMAANKAASAATFIEYLSERIEL